MSASRRGDPLDLAVLRTPLDRLRSSRRSCTGPRAATTGSTATAWSSHGPSARHPVTLVAAPAGYGKTTSGRPVAGRRRTGRPRPGSPSTAATTTPTGCGPTSPRRWSGPAASSPPASLPRGRRQQPRRAAGPAPGHRERARGDAGRHRPRPRRLPLHPGAGLPRPGRVPGREPAGAGAPGDHHAARTPGCASAASAPPSDLAEIRADDLGFTADEAVELLARERRPRCPTTRSSQLMERTEGWPAGLYLATLVAGRASRPRRLRPSVQRRQPLRRRLPDRGGAQPAHRSRARLHHDRLDPGPVLGPAVRPRRRHHRLRGDPPRPGALQPVPRAARRGSPVVPLPPPVRGRGAQRARDHASRRPAGPPRAGRRVVPVPRSRRRGRPALARRGDTPRTPPAGPGQLVAVRRRRPAATVLGWLDSARDAIARRPGPRPASPPRGWPRSVGNETALADHLAALEDFQDFGPLPDGAARSSPPSR